MLYWKEQSGFDLVLSGSGKFSGITVPNGWKRFYPIGHDVVIEHENSPDMCWVGMTKLIKTRAGLKVLVSYSDGEGEKVAEQFRGMIKEAHDHSPENPSTEYLLVIGSRPDMTIQWEAWCWAADGMEKWRHLPKKEDERSCSVCRAREGKGSFH